MFRPAAVDPKRTVGSPQNLPAAGSRIVSNPAFASKCLQSFINRHVGATARSDARPSNVEAQCLVPDDRNCGERLEPQRRSCNCVDNRIIKRQEVFLHRAQFSIESQVFASALTTNNRFSLTGPGNDHFWPKSSVRVNLASFRAEKSPAVSTGRCRLKAEGGGK
jgi:hypothetical protein